MSHHYGRPAWAKHIQRTKTCQRCGRSFHLGETEDWKTLCLDCWRASKANDNKVRIDANELRELRTRADWYREQWNEAADRVEALEDKLALYESKPQNDEIVTWLRANWKQLVALVHPDKHGGAPVANSITADLIRMRRELLQ